MLNQTQCAKPGFLLIKDHESSLNFLRLFLLPKVYKQFALEEIYDSHQKLQVSRYSCQGCKDIHCAMKTYIQTLLLFAYHLQSHSPEHFSNLLKSLSTEFVVSRQFVFHIFIILQQPQKLQKIKKSNDKNFLNFTEQPLDIVVTWTTRSDTGESIVEYGDGNNFINRIVGSREEFIDGGDKHKKQFIHRVIE